MTRREKKEARGRLFRGRERKGEEGKGREGKEGGRRR
jgi:hypothetical protein